MIKREVWMSHFGISEEDAGAWAQELEPGESLLAWCLRQGKIEENAYLQWAAQTYQLPWVKDEFFLDENLQKFWIDSASRAPWKPDLIPLTEWDDVSYIGCLQPPLEAESATFNLGKPTAWILASAKRMGFVFRTYLEVSQAQPAATATTTPESIEMPEGFANFDTSSMVIEQVGSGLEGLKIESDVAAVLAPQPSTVSPEGISAQSMAGAESGATKTETALEMPEGMSFSMDQVEVTFEGIPEGIGSFAKSESANMPSVKSESLGQIEEANFEMPEGMTIELEENTAPPRPSENPDPTQGMSPVAAKPARGEGTMIAVRAMAAVSGKAETPTPPVVASAPAVNMTPPPPPTFAEKASLTVSSPSRGTTDSDADADENSHSANSAKRNFDVTNPSIVTSIGIRKTDKVQNSFDQCQSYEEIAECAFAKMKKHFPKQMIIVFQAGEFKPWMWNGEVIPLLPDQPNSIDLNKPSIFKIVFSTKLPYHGYTKPSPVNDKFFIEWLNGAPPAHVTICPILIEGEIAGMVVGMADKAPEGKATLADMEFWGQGISGAFGRVFANPKAA